MSINQNNISGSIVEQCNCDYLAFLDTSEYLEDVPTNAILRIFPPNWGSSYVDIPYTPNAITLIKPSHIKHATFPCGVYRFVQSVCPNEETEVGFCYLNICQDLKLYSETICNYLKNEESLEELFDIKMGLEAAQGLITGDTCDDKDRAITLYNESVARLNMLANKSDCDVC